ncbi:MAG: hypothetical protein NZM25_00875 [Leptospiraceae bacterium]|nr:hypothetical protein [Leptospiraceae bacterium]MDW8306279.1 nitrilase-related carbon-nitrogen hydrolase [Leptospiraceae bacterium]
MQKVKLAAVSFSPYLGDFEKNLQSHRSLAEHLAPKVDFLFFPELSLCGYLLENLAHECGKTLKELELYFASFPPQITVFAGFVLYENGHFYNAYAGFSQGKPLFVHRKIYLPTYGMFDEARYFSFGQSLDYFLFHSQERAGVLICEDAWHLPLPYAHFLAGVSLVVVPSASPMRGVQDEREINIERWKGRLLCYSESLNQFYLYVNRAGIDDGVLFPGEVFLVSPLRGLIPALEEGEFEKNRYKLFLLDFEERQASAAKGGPWQNDCFSLNKALLEKSHHARF